MPIPPCRYAIERFQGTSNVSRTNRDTEISLRRTVLYSSVSNLLLSDNFTDAIYGLTSTKKKRVGRKYRFLDNLENQL